MRVMLLCHGRTAAVLRAAFPVDEPLDEQGRLGASRLAGTLPETDEVVSAPSLRCRQTAELTGLRPRIDPSLASADFGSWAGKTLDEINQEPLRIWLNDPMATPHGGESLADLLARVGTWLSTLTPDQRSVLVIADASVIRSAIVHAVIGRPESVWRIDIAPLSRTVLVGEPGRWNLRSLG